MTHPDGLAWHRQAACQGHPVRFWYPQEQEQEHRGVLICERCPVRQPCLAYALEHQEWFGTWGGVPQVARRRMLPD